MLNDLNSDGDLDRRKIEYRSVKYHARIWRLTASPAIRRCDEPRAKSCRQTSYESLPHLDLWRHVQEFVAYPVGVEMTIKGDHPASTGPFGKRQ